MTAILQAISRRSIVGLYCAVAFTLAALSDGLPAPANATLPPGAGPQFSTLAPVVQQVTPAVVSIAVRARVREENPLFRDPYFRRFFGPPEQLDREVMAAGSGVIVDSQRGYVLTNSHVVEHADVIEVTTKDNRRFRATLVGRDPGTDIAVLRIPGGSPSLPSLPLGDSDRLQVGDFVMAIGNPFGLGQTVTSGIISALGRSMPGGYGTFIQTDASINPGNSGGALVDMQGRLIGINSAMLSASGGNIGIGFAVPINTARRAMHRIVRHGWVQPGRIGIVVHDLNPVVAGTLRAAETRGVAIAAVEPGSPAAQAGLQVNDIVLAAGDAPVSSAAELQDRIQLTPVGQQVRLAVKRNGVSRFVWVRVAPATDAQAGGGF
jgi:Do/DeqQ family serine protease